jgi:hypothetical protein
MPSFFKGAAVGTYWHQNDARTTGFVAHSPGQPHTVNRVQQHVARGSIQSPYISFTTSYGIAEDYAIYFGLARPTASSPAYVYEVDLSASMPSALDVLDPMVYVATNAIGSPLANPYYQHDGDSSFLSDVADRATTALTQNVKFPPSGPGTARAPIFTIELETIVRALRDSEILMRGVVPSANVVNRWPVY